MNSNHRFVNQHHQPMNYVADNIRSVLPQELKQINQWITWKAGAIKSEGKFDKLPIGKDGSGREWQQSHQWMTFEEAMGVARRRGHSGVGLVLPAKTDSGNHIVALDYDSVDLNQVDDDLRLAEIRKTHKILGEPYLEKSPSGKGIRIFVQSSASIDQVSSANPLGGKDELFCASGKWVTVTGCTLGGSGMPEVTEEIQELASCWNARNYKIKSQVGNTTNTPAPDMFSHLVNSGWDDWPKHLIRDGEGREEIMLSYAGHLRSKGISQSRIEQLCLQANVDRYADRLDIEVVLDRARRYAVNGNELGSHGASPDSIIDLTLLEQVDRTDAGNVALLFNLTNGEIRFVHEFKTWIVWHNGRWHYDKPNALIHSRLLKVAVYYQELAGDLSKKTDEESIDSLERKNIKDAVKKIEKWVAQCRSKKFLDSMQILAQRDSRFLVNANLIDADPWLLGVENGVVDLRSGALSQDSKDRFVLKRCPVKFNPDAKASRWTKFIDEITSYPDGFINGKVQSKSSPELVRYLQKALGYSITGRVNEHVMFIAIGSGANGKNVLLDTVKSVGGDYMETIAPEVLMATKLENGAEQASPSVRKLAGARCAFSSESKDGQKLDIAVVKRHTGGGSMTARALHENPVTFEMTHKLWLMTNHTPQIDHIDSATKGRLNMIPFRMKWNRPGETRPDPKLENADKSLMDKLKLEHEGILLWLIHGAICYHKEGLNPPSEVTAFTQDYIQSQDSFTRWLNECELCSIEEGFTAGNLFLNYVNFCRQEEQRQQIDTSARLGKRLREQGYESERTRDGSRYNLRPKQQTPLAVDGLTKFIGELNANEDTTLFTHKPVTV